MLIRIRHVTTYEYDRPVSLGPHTLLLRPRDDGTQRLHEFSLAIEPQSARVASGLGLDGNAFTSAWFDGACQRLRIETRALVETHVTNPFLLTPAPDAWRIGFDYPQGVRAQLAPYLEGPPVHEDVAALAQEVAREANGESVAFLWRLAARIAESHKQVVREEGPPLPPAETLARGEGACRDLAVLHMAAARRMGFACRFVSGYQVKPENDRGDELHAWVEAFLPGAGWRGFDPSAGLAVADRHVPVAAAPMPAGAMPVTGAFVGAGASSRMRAEVDARVVSASPSPTRPLPKE